MDSDEPQEQRAHHRVLDVLAFEKRLFDLHIKLLKDGAFKRFPRSFPRRMVKLSRELAKAIEDQDFDARVKKLEEMYACFLAHGLDLPN